LNVQPKPSRLGLGTVKLGRNRDVKYPDGFELPDDASVEALLEGALAMGVNTFDTAPAYGTSESRLSNFVRSHRDEIVLCTKAGEEFDEKGSRYDFSPGHLRSSCERSLRRLGTDHVDLLFLHSDGNDLQILDETAAVEELQQLKLEGKTRAVGISAKTERGIERASELLDAVMAPLSVSQSELSEAMRSAHRKGLLVFAIKILASGHAATESDGAQAVARALDFVFEQAHVDCAVLGTLKLGHLEQAAARAARS